MLPMHANGLIYFTERVSLIENIFRHDRIPRELLQGITAGYLLA